MLQIGALLLPPIYGARPTMYCDRVPMKNRITLAAILVSATLTVMAGAIVAPALNPMAAGLGVSPAAARLIITTHAILIAVCSPFMGMAIDAWGVRRPFAAGLIFYGLAGASGLLAPGYWTIIAGRVALGVAVAAVYTAVTVSIFRLYSGAERNKVMGWRASSNALGGMVWPLLGGLLAGVAWRLPFSVYLIGIPLGLLVLTQLPTAETGDAAADEAEAAPDEAEAAGGISGAGGTAGTSSATSVLELFRSTRVLFVTYAIMFVTMLLLYSVVVFMPSLLKEMGSDTPIGVGGMLAVSAVAAGAMAALYGRIRARLPYPSIISIALTAWIVGFLIIAVAPNIPLVALGVALFGAGQGLALPSAMVWSGESVPPKFQGRITSYLATFGFVAQFVSPLLLSPVSGALGVSGMYMVVSAAMAMALGAWLAGWQLSRS